MSNLSRMLSSDSDGGVPRPSLHTILKWVVVAIVVLVLVSIWPFASVPTGSRGVVTRFGKITNIEPEGLVILLPWEKLQLFSIRSERADIDDAEGSTADTQPVKVSLTVRYSIVPNKVAEVYEQYSHDGDLSSYIQTATQEVFKAVTARYVATDLISKRAQVSGDINAALRAKVERYGANIVNIDMRNFTFSADYMAAINQKVTQEQLRLAAENKVRTVQAEEQQKVVIAQAEANAVRAKADGDAYATLTTAKANADALRIQNDALVSSEKVLELRRIEVDMQRAKNWNGQLPTVMLGGAVPMLDVSKFAAAAASKGQ